MSKNDDQKYRKIKTQPKLKWKSFKKPTTTIALPLSSQKEERAEIYKDKKTNIYVLYLPFSLQMIQIRNLLISLSEDLLRLYNLCKWEKEQKKRCYK